MKGIISVVIFVPTLQIFIFSIESYNIKCPLQAHWKMRAKVRCNNTQNYFCLYNNVDGKYVEGCNGPDWDRPGSKRIYVGDFSRGDCMPERFQPYKYWTNESMSDCIYTKSICSAEGQIVYKDDSRKADRSCGCDYTQNYSFMKTPKHICFCLPTEEDCSCYIKSCQVNFSLSADYECTQNGTQKNTKCTDIAKYHETMDESNVILIEHNDDRLYGLTFKWRDTDAAIIFWCLCFMHIIVAIGFFIKVLFSTRTCQKIITDSGYINMTKELEERYHDHIAFEAHNVQHKVTEVVDAESSRSTLDSKKQNKDDSKQTSELVEAKVDRLIQYVDELDVALTDLLSVNSTCKNNEESFNNADNLDVTVTDIHIDYVETIQRSNHEFIDNTYVDTNQIRPTTDEVNLLRIIHLLFRVACPVVRMTLNNEIQPDQLRKAILANKAAMHKIYRKKNTINTDFQEDLPIKHSKGKNVSSEDFDIGYMMHLLQKVADFQIGVLYPVPSDTSICAMLSRIKYIRSETTELFEGKLEAEVFSQYWDDIGQAILKLMSSHKPDVKNDPEKKRLIGRLFALNPITIDNKKLCVFIDISETYPSLILRKIISEYCFVNNLSTDVLLENEKHQLYHKRIRTESCCKCKTGFPTFIKIITEKQWEALYQVNKRKNRHNCEANLGTCCENFVSKKVETLNLSAAKTLILNTPTLLTYLVHRLYVTGFETFLTQNQHTLYHSMVKTKCCKCSNVPTETLLIDDIDWNKLFLMKGDKSPCKTTSNKCCCQFSVRNGIKYSDLEHNLLSKVFHVAGPIGVLNKIEQDAILYFLNWTVDEKHLLGGLKELLNVIKDKEFCLEIQSSIPPQSNESKATQKDARMWVTGHLSQKKATTEQQLQVLVSDEDGLNVKIVQIPKGYTLPHRTKIFTDITAEENNFLVVVYGLTKIVYPVIKDEFIVKCTDEVLGEIHMDIYKQQQEKYSNDKNNSKMKRIYLTQRQQHLLFVPKNNEEKYKNLDLKLMIYILKQVTEAEGDKDYVDQLNVIDEIRREIVLSSSGVLSESRLHNILDCIQKAVLHLGGQLSDGTILQLRQLKNILELQ